MKPEDLKSKLDSAATKEDFNAVQAAVDKQNASLETIKNSLAALTAPKIETPVTPSADEDAVRLLANPSEFLRDANRDVRMSQDEIKAQMAELQARQNPELAGFFRQYPKEAADLAAKAPVNLRAQANFWVSAVNQILGDKVRRGEIREGKFPSLLGASSVGVRADGTTEDTNFGFSDEMASFFKERGKSLKDMAFIRDRMDRRTGAGETIDLASWKGRPH